MIRNSIKFVDDTDMKALIIDLKQVYQADDEDQSVDTLEHFEQFWAHKYLEIRHAWRKKWAIRRLIYTTNSVEGLQGMLRKTTECIQKCTHL